MQQSIGLKRFVSTHLGATVLAFGVVISLTLGVVGLEVSGNLPWMTDGESRGSVSRPMILAPSQVEHAVQVEQMQQFYEHKEVRLETDELQRSALAAQAARQDTLRRYVEHKEKTLNAMP